MASNFSDLDQLFLEYVNRARLDPGREVARLLADPGVTNADLIASLEGLQSAGLNRGLAGDPISGQPLQALAPNDLLWNAAEGHSQWMLDANIFSHYDGTGADASESIKLRIEAAGYEFTGGHGWGENLSWTGIHPGPVDMEAAVINHAAGLFDSDGHRANILADFFRETGVAQLEGTFTQGGTDYNASMLTQKFALSGSNVFLTGVIYTDSDGDGFYSLGEGQSGVTIATTAASTVSATHGGYALGIAPAANVEVTLTWGSVDIGATVDLSGDNVKLDLVAGSDDSLRLLSSGDLTLGAGASEAGLLGAANLSLQGNDDGNLLIGNFGDNMLTGGAGNDTLEGGAGNDTLDGGGGVNTAVFSGDMGDYDITTDDTTGITTVTDNRAGTVLNPNDGVNTLQNIQYIQFADTLHSLAAPGDNGGGPDMSAFSINGFGFSFNPATNQVTAITGSATLALTFATENPVISYSQITLFDEFGDPDFGVLPDIEIGGHEPSQILLNNKLLNTDEAYPSVGRLTWTDGGGAPRATDVFNIYISDSEQYFFVLGGDPIPENPTPAQLNDILFEAVMNNGGVTPLPLPPAGSDFPPDTPIALTDVDSWEQADTSGLQTITLSGFSVLDGGPGEPPSSAGLQPSQFALVFAEPGASLIHQVSGDDLHSDAPIVQLSFDQLPIALMLNGEPMPMPEPDQFEILAGRIVSDGQIYDVLILDDFANDRIHFITLGGEPLPDGTSVAAVDELLGGLSFFGEIPEGEPTSAGTPILLSGIPGAVVTDGADTQPPEPVEGTGDPAVISFSGFRINEDEDDNLLGFEEAELTLALAADDIVYSYTILPDPDGEGLDVIEIEGPNPYAFLIDGVVPFNFPQIGVERITVDGVDYDLMLVQLPGVEGATFVFQLDGATPLPFTDFAAVQDFIEKADDDGAFGPIPASSPFAPGNDFTFLNSPYATSNTDPQIIEGGDFWREAHGAEYGLGADTAGGLTIVNGADLTLTADGLEGPFMSVGRAGGYGVVTVAGPDSSLDLVAGGGIADPNWGASISIGRDGGVGGMRILDGGSFGMTDPVGTTAGPDSDGNELLWVGRGFGGYGFVDVIAGSFLHAGTGTIAAYGRAFGAEGYLYVAGGGTYRQQTTSDNDFTYFAIGREGGFGEAVVDHGRVTIQAGDNGNGTVDIGAYGSGGHDTPGGILRIYGTNDGGFPVHGLMITGGADSPFVEAVLGRDGGGLVEMYGGYFGVLNRGVTYDDDLNQIDLPGDGGEAEMSVGRDGGRAEINANDGAEVFVSGTEAGRMFIGAGEDSRGEVFLDDAEIRVYSWDGEAGLEVGTWNGGTGLLRMLNGSDADIWGGVVGAYVNIGHGDGSYGELEMVDSTATIRSDNDAWAYLGVATNGGAADMFMTDSNLTVMADGDGDPSVDIGRDANATAFVDITGTLDMEGDTQHGLVAMGGANSGYAGIDIGKYGGSGTVIVNAAYFGALNNGSHFDPETGDLVPLGGTGGMAGIRVGHEGGSGEFHAMNGADIFVIGGSDQGHFIVGDGPDSYGDAHFDASSIDLSAQSGFAFMGVGRRGGEGHLSLSNGSEVIFDAPDHASVAADVGARGGEGTLLVEGGSSIDGGGLGSLYVGSEYSDNPGTGGADGLVTLTGDGSRITGFRELLIGDNEPETGTATGVVNVLDGAFIQLGHPDINNSSNLYIGRYGGAHGALNITDGFVALQGANGSDGDGEAWRPYTAIGYSGGTGHMNITGTVPGQEDNTGFVQIGGGESRFSIIDVGHGADSEGTVSVSGGFFGTENRGATYATEPPFDPVDLPGDGGRALIRVGVEGATGEVTASSNALIFIESGEQSGVAIPAEDVGGSVLLVGGETAAAGGGGGTGTVTMDGSRLEISSIGGLAGLRIGNGETGTGIVNLLNGTAATIEAGTIGFIGVGREGGNGNLSLDGAGTTLSVTGVDGVSILVGADEDSNGMLSITDGAELQLEPGTTGALMEIGKDGGHGAVSLAGADAALAFAAGGGSEIRIATEGAGSFGLLHVADGASVTTGTVSVGAADTKGVLVFADGGSLSADTVTVNAEGVLGGTGVITGDVVINGGAVGAGDTWLVDGGPTDGGWGIGTLTVEGSFTQTEGMAYFDFGETGNDLLDVTGALSFTDTEFTLQYNGDLPAAGFEVLLAQAAGGISLEDVILAATSFDEIGGALPELELREGGTELWFTTAADLPPPTGQALDMAVIGQEGATITYGVSIDPALVTDGVLDELLFTLNFDDTLISYVPGTISGDFTATPGSLVISGSDLGIDEFGAPILTFDMRLEPAAGAGSISFDISDVSVNGVAMEDQTGVDLAYDAAFFTLGGVVDIRDLRADPTTPDGTVVTFTESGGTAHEVTLGAGGSFSFLLEQGTEGSLEILRDYDTAVDKTLGLGDVFNLLYLVANYSDGGPLPWDTATADTWIAGDFTGNGQAQLTDVFQLLYHVADYHEALHDPRWVFIDQDESWDDLGTGNVPQPGAFDIGPISDNIDMSFLGILTGDLQGYV